MEERGHKDILKKLIISMLDNEMDDFVSKKSLHKYLSGNLDKVIDNNIGKLSTHKLIYSRVLRNCSNQINLSSISKIIRSEKLFKEKEELLKFGKYLDIGINNKLSYNRSLKIISSHIHKNKNHFSKRFISYKRGDKEYFLEPEIIKDEILNNYQHKMKKDMESLAKMFEVELDYNNSAEQIRQEIIKHIISNKLKK